MPVKYGSPALRNYRFYLAVDVSNSMLDDKFYGGMEKTPLERLNVVLPEMTLRLLREPLLAGRTWLSVSTFGSEFRVHLPSVLVDQCTGFAELKPGGATDFKALMKGLAHQIHYDTQHLPLAPGRHWYRPAVFILTDGYPCLDGTTPQPDSEWMPERNVLIDQFDANIISLGLGSVGDDVLARVATLTAKGLPLAFADEGTMQASQLVDSIKTALLRTMLRSAQTGDLDVPLPRGMRRVGSRLA